MANKSSKAQEKLDARRQEEAAIAQDVVWYKKLRDVAPRIERTKPVENPFKDLLKSRQRTEAVDTPSNDRAETDQ